MSCSSENLEMAQADLGDIQQENLFANSELRSFSVPAGAVSVTLMGDGGMGESDMDISYLKGPDGFVYVTEDWTDADSGGRSQNFGDSTATLTIPNGNYTAPLSGIWEYKVGCETCQGVTADDSFKEEVGTNVKVNVILVSQNDITSPVSSDPALREVIDEFKNEYEANGFNVTDIRYWTLDSDDTDISSIDANGNGQFDGMDRLFNNVTPDLPEGYLNVFFVRAIGSGGILGIAGGIPGPPINGTPHSGVIVSTLGGLSGLSLADRRMQGNTMAHEMAHYFGLFHPTEGSGTSFDPITDTPECKSSKDANGDGVVSASECSGAGGENMMFWAAPTSGFQTALTDGQKYVMQRAANIN